MDELSSVGEATTVPWSSDKEGVEALLFLLSATVLDGEPGTMLNLGLRTVGFEAAFGSSADSGLVSSVRDREWVW